VQDPKSLIPGEANLKKLLAEHIVDASLQEPNYK